MRLECAYGERLSALMHTCLYVFYFGDSHRPLCRFLLMYKARYFASQTQVAVKTVGREVLQNGKSTAFRQQTRDFQNLKIKTDVRTSDLHVHPASFNFGRFFVFLIFSIF